MSITDTIKLTKSETDYLAEMKSKSNKEDGCCEKCNDNGFIFVENNNIEECVICDCKKQKQWEQTFFDAGIPRGFTNKSVAADWNVSQDAFGNDLGSSKKIKADIGRFIDKYIKAIPAIVGGIKLVITRPGRSSLKINSLLLVGGNKSGKSLLAAIAVQEALTRGLTAKMYDWTELFDILSDFHKKDQQEILTNEFMDLHFIAIDGVAMETATQSPCFITQLDRLSRIITKYDKPILITSSEHYCKKGIGSNWQSLVESCYKIKLPSPRVDNNEKKQEQIVKTRTKIKQGE